MTVAYTKNEEVILLAGGCFWCVEAVFNAVQGVSSAISGYSNGQLPGPTYAQVCSGSTGHAEVVRISFDTAVIALPELLEIFFAIHDPTTLNQQGADHGTQYRSGIYYFSEMQRRVAVSTIQRLSTQGIWSSPIVTEVLPAGEFYPAEDYHQQYFARNPAQGYCAAVVGPKVAKFRQKFLTRLKT